MLYLCNNQVELTTIYSKNGKYFENGKYNFQWRTSFIGHSGFMTLTAAARLTQTRWNRKEWIHKFWPHKKCSKNSFCWQTQLRDLFFDMKYSPLRSSPSCVRSARERNPTKWRRIGRRLKHLRWKKEKDSLYLCLFTGWLMFVDHSKECLIFSFCRLLKKRSWECLHFQGSWKGGPWD